MTRQRLTALRVSLMAADAVITVVAFVAASWLRFGDTWEDVWKGLLPRPEIGLTFYAAAAVATFWLAGMYRLRSRWTMRGELRDITRGVSALVLVTFSLLYVFKLDQVSRLFLIYFFAVSTTAVVVVRVLFRSLFRLLRSSARSMLQTLVVGSSEEVQSFLDTLRSFPELGLKLVGFLRPQASLAGLRRLGSLSDLPTVLADNVVDEVLVCLPFHQWGELDDLIRERELQRKTVRIPAASVEALATRSRVERIGSTPVITLSRRPDRTAALVTKRAMDIVGSLVALVVFAPLMMAVALTVLISDGWPILYVDRRAGLHGRPIKVHKFRTMAKNADALRPALAAKSDRVGPDFKVNNDPRVTPLGAFLRRTSLDELPQLWDVLRGCMSLVGPRAQRLGEAAGYERWHLWHAADIYVDSFPFGSLTSLFEAGSHAVPFVGFDPYDGEAVVLRADDPALATSHLRIASPNRYLATLGNLIENSEERRKLGIKYQEAIRSTHWGADWQRALENIYARVCELLTEERPARQVPMATKGSHPLDLALAALHEKRGTESSPRPPSNGYVSLLPFGSKVQHLFTSQETLRQRFVALLPDWSQYFIRPLTRYLGQRLRIRSFVHEGSANA